MAGYRQHERFSSAIGASMVFDMRHKRLRKLLSRVVDEDFLNAVWVLEWGRDDGFVIPRGYDFPRECLHAGIADEGRIHSWELETVLTEALATPKQKGRRIANPRSWNFFAAVISALRSAENAEGGRLKTEDVFRDLNRALYRQLPWQSRPEGLADIIRWQSIFSNKTLLGLYVENVGLEPQKMMWIAVAFFQDFRRFPIISKPRISSELYFTESDIDAFFLACADTLPNLRKRAVEISRHSGLAFRESPFRQKPLVQIGEGKRKRYVCPLKLPLFWRVTSGLYYDIVQEPSAWNLIGAEFELFERRLVAAAFPEAVVDGDIHYGIRKEPKKTPDILVSREGILDVAFECKAKRLPLAEKMSATQHQRESLAIGELAKGVFQLVRFRMDLRQGKFDGLRECEHTQYVVLTLDDWIFTGRTTKDDVFYRVGDLISRKNIEVDFDIRDVVFCTAAEFDTIVCRISLDQIIGLFGKNRRSEFREYASSSLLREFSNERVTWDSYPLAQELDISDLVAHRVPPT